MRLVPEECLGGPDGGGRGHDVPGDAARLAGPGRRQPLQGQDTLSLK